MQYKWEWGSNDLIHYSHAAHGKWSISTPRSLCSGYSGLQRLSELPGSVYHPSGARHRSPLPWKPFRCPSLWAISLTTCSNNTLTSKLSQVFKPFTMAQLHLPGTAWGSLLKCFRGTFWILHSFRCCNICIHIMRHLGMRTKSKHEIHLCITYAYLKCYMVFLVCLYFDYSLSHEVRHRIFPLVVSS